MKKTKQVEHLSELESESKPLHYIFFNTDKNKYSVKTSNGLEHYQHFSEALKLAKQLKKD